MKWLLCFATATLFATGTFAQPQSHDHNSQSHDRDHDERIEYIHSIKVAYITRKVHLTSEEAQKFWPVYNAYEKELISLRKNYFQKYRNADHDHGNDEMTLHRFDDDMDFQHAKLDFQYAKLDLKKKYKEPLLKVLSPQQLSDLFRAESEFNSRLMQRMKENRRGDDNRRDDNGRDNDRWHDNHDR